MVECRWESNSRPVAHTVSTRTRPHSVTPRESVGTEARALQRSPTGKQTLPHSAALSRNLPHFATLCRTLPHSAALCCTLLHSAALCCTLLHSAALCCTRPVSGVAAHTIHRHGSTEPPHGGAGRVSPPALLFESRTHRAGGPAAAAPAASFLNAQPPVRAGPFSATSQSSLSYSVTRRQRHASAALATAATIQELAKGCAAAARRTSQRPRQRAPAERRLPTRRPCM